METLERLDHAFDFQAVATCTRSLLEALVDLVLITNDGTGALTAKMGDWATSAKFKACAGAVNYYMRQGQQVPDCHRPMEDFYLQNKLLVGSLRAKHWSNKHPDRWTGANLQADCKEADLLEPIRIQAELETSLDEFYETQIRRMNWSVHGSGVALLGRASEDWFYLFCALAFNWSSKLAVLISILTMKALRFNEAIENMDVERKALKRDRLEAFFAMLRAEMGKT
jgi:hypothetical protein